MRINTMNTEMAKMIIARLFSEEREWRRMVEERS
jgi:hypothetical protein